MRVLHALAFLSLSVWLSGCGSDSSTSNENEGKPNKGLQEAVDSAALDTLRVGTLNMTVGWRAEGLVLKKLTDTLQVHAAVKDLYAQFLDSRPSERIRLMAQAIVDHPVDVLALQEVQVMRVNGEPAYHFLDTLLYVLDSLEGPGHWQVARQQINRVAADVTDSAGVRMDIEFWEGQATLLRSGLKVLEADSALYAKRVSFPILAEDFASERGWLRTTIRTEKGGLWQLYNTHLEVELLSLFNTPQGMELNGQAWEDWQGLEDGAQVVMGDLNSYGGNGGLGALTSAGSGLLDSWSLRYGQETSEAYTCCADDLLRPEANTYSRRLDYVLVRNLLSVDTLQTLPLRNETIWAGDHAFVRAVLVRQM